ncbi:hypothetical protein CFIO01_10789 [Colletotrichum fioriniae PJ7]|uniref:Uncharacterized protein n=1 Tax=Colletotrichum fioriniae PJ7 TaxID=1445577 RepID=A0A010S4D2_9PEZI|nr:hypothetical protein CFIO01_10789 [Colletotrichum fioriniae PJ7]
MSTTSFASPLGRSLRVSLSSLGSALGAAVCSWGLKAAAPARPSRRGVALTQRSHCSHEAPWRPQAMSSICRCEPLLALQPSARQKLGETGHFLDRVVRRDKNRHPDKPPRRAALTSYRDGTWLARYEKLALGEARGEFPGPSGARKPVQAPRTPPASC